MGAGVVKSGGGKRRRGSRRSRAQPMSEINVTPFVDVMLVLLIIFMVAAPLLTVGVPKTAAQALPAETEEPLTVTLSADGEVLIQTTVVSRDELVGRLRAIAAERSDDRVYLRADGSVPYEQVAQIMGALNAGGFSSIGLVTDVGGPALDGPDGG